MPALSFTSLDRFIEPSSSSSKEIASSTDRSTPTPFSFYPPLYATPSPQRPPSPSSFSPSPYVLNFKRRGPVLQHLNAGKEGSGNASSDLSVQAQDHRVDAFEGTIAEPSQLAKNAVISSKEDVIAKNFGEGLPENEVFEIELDKRDAFKNASSRNSQGHVTKDEHICIDSSSKTESGAGCTYLIAPPSPSSLAINEEVEFFDAPESVVFPDSASEDEIGSSSGKPGRCVGRCSGRTTSRLEEEVTRRIKAEETVALWQRRWNEMAKRCSSLGLSIASQTGNVLEDAEDSSEVLTQELLVARLVGGAIASAVVRAEKDEELERVMGVKNWEISRLYDKLQYLELVNREMSQRNQEVIELTQRRRKRRQRRRKLALGGFCAAICIGTAGLVCYKFVPLDHIKELANLFEKSSAGQSRCTFLNNGEGQSMPKFSGLFLNI